jgi:hypothetical protein
VSLPQAWFVVQRTGHPRFPFRITVSQGGRQLLAVRSQSQWPGPGQQVFCLREGAADADPTLPEVERVPVRSLSRVGRKLALALDRPQRKRCEFLAVEKLRKEGEGSYEQVFFRTQSGITAHRSRTRVELRSTAGPLTIAIDSGERYPWPFPGADVSRRRLPAGDYALVEGHRTLAVVERKSYDNLLGDIGAVQALHLALAHLAAQPAPALVIEAQYGDFLDRGRLKGRWPPAHVARVLAELAVLHPGLPIIFAGNRKLAASWTATFFGAVRTRHFQPELELGLVQEAVAAYMPGAERDPDLDTRITQIVLAAPADGLSVSAIVRLVDGATPARVKRVIDALRLEGRVQRLGRGRGACWAPASPRSPPAGQVILRNEPDG